MNQPLKERAMLLRSRLAIALAIVTTAMLWAGVLQAQNTAPVPTTFSIDLAG